MAEQAKRDEEEEEGEDTGTLLYVFFFSRSSITRLFYFICLSVIINYDFDLSDFIFPKSGVKISESSNNVKVLSSEIEQRLQKKKLESTHFL